MTNNVKVIGFLTWSELRDYIVKQLLNANSEEEVTKIITQLVSSMGTIEQIKATRKKLGITPLTKKELMALEEQ